MADITICDARASGIYARRGGWALTVYVDGFPKVRAAKLLVRFVRGESMESLARSKGVPLRAIEETIRWYANHPRERSRDLGEDR